MYLLLLLLCIYYGSDALANWKIMRKAQARTWITIRHCTWRMYMMGVRWPRHSPLWSKQLLGGKNNTTRFRICGVHGCLLTDLLLALNWISKFTRFCWLFEPQMDAWWTRVRINISIDSNTSENSRYIHAKPESHSWGEFCMLLGIDWCGISDLWCHDNKLNSAARQHFICQMHDASHFWWAYLWTNSCSEFG